MKKTDRIAFKRLLPVVMLLTCVTAVLSACHEKPDNTPPQTTETASTAPTAAEKAAQTLERRNELMDSVSGVWKPAEGGSLLTVYVSGNHAQAAQGDKALNVALGDVDPSNGTVVLKVTTGGKEELRTLARLESEDGGSDSLQIIGDDGEEHYYGFVRKISNDDLNRITRLSASPAAPAGNRSVVDMYIGAVDMNMRSCPGSTCSALIIVPKDSKVQVDTATIRNVTEASGANTPWARVTYEGAYCKPAEHDPLAPCEPTQGTDAPVIGWMNYVRLLKTPRA